MDARRQYVAFETIVIKEVRRFMRIWVQTLIPPAISMVLYFVIFGNLIGRRIGEMDGYDYMQFIVPGLIMMAVINNAYANVVSSFFGNKFQKSIEELLVSPTPHYVILAGFVVGGVARGILVGLLVLVLSLFFSELRMEHPGLTILVLLLTATLFSVGGFINAVYATKFDDISIVPTFILTPMTYLGGVFYSITLLPEFWQGVSMLNPILYMVNAFRYGILGVSDIDVRFALLMVVGFTVLGIWYSLRLLDRGTGIRS